MKYAIIVVALMLITVSAVLLFPLLNKADPNYTYVMPPAHSLVTVVGDYIYFLSANDQLKKYNKATLAEVDSVTIDNCNLGVYYSDYLDKLILLNNISHPQVISIVDYNDMEIEQQYEFNLGPIGDFRPCGDKLYIVWDDSGLESYNEYMLPENEGVLTEYELDEMTENWSVNVATMPMCVNLAGEYVIITSDRIDDNRDEVGYPYVVGNIVSIVNRNTEELVKQFPASSAGVVPSAWDGDSKFYISNAMGAYYKNEHGATIDREMGLSILDLSTMEVEHHAFETVDTIGQLTCSFHAAYDDGYLYLTYFNSKYNNTAYFGIMDTATMEVENIPLSGLDKFLLIVTKDADDLYFVTSEGGLVKYTLTE